ncbi:uncharacterized protein LOC105395340 isoform X1 [Plutella xylostella]|uniref:uncharacterized protein LOC105395340 isoform X1 n=1 Tax=Plutella xylostella TaxID=51655 RepID=UPI002032A223|nr:uncharacterized protein LOC105395340 isoform X1 [Plutella xylostella]
MRLFVLVLVVTIVNVINAKVTDENSTKKCDAMGDCISDCTEKCGCDRAYIYNETTNECKVNFKYIMSITIEKYNNQEKIRQEAERIFKGITISAIFIICCAATCALTACTYCCRINYADYKLKSDVDALTKKIGRDKQRKPDKTKIKPEAESCNVIVEDAGVFVV